VANLRHKVIRPRTGTPRTIVSSSRGRSSNGRAHGLAHHQSARDVGTGHGFGLRRSNVEKTIHDRAERDHLGLGTQVSRRPNTWSRTPTWAKRDVIAQQPKVCGAPPHPNPAGPRPPDTQGAQPRSRGLSQRFRRTSVRYSPSASAKRCSTSSPTTKVDNHNQRLLARDETTPPNPNTPAFITSTTVRARAQGILTGSHGLGQGKSNRKGQVLELHPPTYLRWAATSTAPTTPELSPSLPPLTITTARRTARAADSR